MAVGIAAMAIVVLLGLVPAGLTAIRDAGTNLAEARIFQQVASEVQGADWGVGGGDALSYNLLSQYNNARRFFDDQGTPLAENQANSMRLSYVARIRINETGTSATVPGGVPSNNLASLTIDVAAANDPRFSFGEQFPFKTRTALIARQY